MLMGKLAKLSGLTCDTIRFYEKKGLIQVGRKERRFNNYRKYSEDTLQTLLQIQYIKGYGFTLNEATELLGMIKLNTVSCCKVSEKVTETVQLINQRIAQLQDLKAFMINNIEKCLLDFTT